MFPFSSKKGSGSVVAIFDIGSSSVGGALVQVFKDKKPEILYSTRQQMNLKEELDIKEFTNSMIRTLGSTLDRIEKKGLIHLNFRKLNDKSIREAFCFFSSPWYISQTRVIEIEKQKPFSITDDLINSLVKEEKDSFMKNKGEFFGKDNNVEFMDTKVVQIRLNGYKVAHPYGKKVKELSTSIFMSLIPVKVADRVEETIIKNLNLEKIHMHSFALASFLGIRDIFEAEDDFVFLDVGGEVTDISYVKNDSLREVQTFPLGRNSFARAIVKEFKTSGNNAVSMIDTYSKDKLDTKNKEKLEKAFSEERKNWVKYLEDGMLELSQGAILPRTIFITADDNIGKILVKILKEENFSKLVFPDYNKALNPILIKFDNFKDYFDINKGTEKDVFIGIEAFFINRLLK